MFVCVLPACHPTKIEPQVGEDKFSTFDKSCETVETTHENDQKQTPQRGAAPTIVINGVIFHPYTWRYKSVTGVISPL